MATVVQLLLLDTCESTRKAVRAAAVRGGHELSVIDELADAQGICGKFGVEAVLVSPRFFDGPAARHGLLAHCDTAFHAVVFLVESTSELAELDFATKRVIDDYVVKPLDPDGLVTRLEIIASRRTHRSRERAILAALPDLVFRFDRAGHYLDFHAPKVADLYASPDEIIGRNISAVLPASAAALAREALEATIDTGDGRNFEYALPAGDGVTHWEARMVKSGPGEALAIVREITEQKSVLDQLDRSRALARAFASSILHLQESERQRLSQELHDAIGQMLLVHRMDVELIEKSATTPEQRAAAAALERSLESTLEMVRSLAFGLRPPQLDDLGLGSALKALLSELVGRAGLESRCRFDAVAATCRGDVGVVLYRIAQEALTNAIRHAECETIALELSHPDGTMKLSIEDNGKGVDPKYCSDTATVRGVYSMSLGITGMRERAELLGGSLHIARGAQGGTRVVATIPHQLASGAS